jgi:hypothetical protein
MGFSIQILAHKFGIGTIGRKEIGRKNVADFSTGRVYQKAEMYH